MVFITGGTGFVGSYIIRDLLLQGQKVVAIKRASSDLTWLSAILEESKLSLDQVEWKEGDVLDIPSLEEAMSNVDQVYHCAAMISFDPRKQKQMSAVNIEGTANVVNVALANSVKKMVHLSSISVFGRYVINHPIDETLMWKEHSDNTHYAISKHRAELEVWRAQEEGLSTVIVNPSTIIGFGNWNNGSCKIFKNIYEGLSFAPSGMMGWVDVQDVSKICIQLMNSDIERERFIVSAENHRFSDIFEKIANAFDVAVPRRKITPWLAALAWRWYWLHSRITGKEPLVTRETTQYTQRDYRYVNSKVKKHVHVEFRSIESSIRETCSKYQTMLANKLHQQELVIE